jgi:hypothetical protein
MAFLVLVLHIVQVVSMKGNSLHPRWDPSMASISPDIGVQGWWRPSIRSIAHVAWRLNRTHEGAVALVDARRIAGWQDQFAAPATDDGMGGFG